MAQFKPIKSDIDANITRHIELINLAVSQETDIIIFPELSLTGYEPRIANSLATKPDDARFTDFQKISNSENIIIGVGIPLRKQSGVSISMILFHPNSSKQIYSKKYLHPDENQFFIPGQNSIEFVKGYSSIALAICYEISVSDHAENVSQQGSEFYIASVAKTIDGVKEASKRLAAIAKQYSMTVLMSNCVGKCDGEMCAGSSSIWNAEGYLINHLNELDEGILIFNTLNQEVKIIQ